MVVRKNLLDVLDSAVSDCYLAFKNERDGKPADYIPALKKVDPDLFAIAICTVDGDTFLSGDWNEPYSIQSVSKPFLYATALSKLGERAVLKKVGVEPTGYNFSSIVRLERGSNRADNPMVNAGAIAIAGLIAQASKEKSVDVSAIFKGFMDRDDIAIDNEIFSSEVSTGNRNYSIGNLLKYHGIIDGTVESALDLYFRACSTKIDTRDLSIMAATLANYGINPLTRKRAILEEHTAKVLAVMSTCGLYDYSGEFAFFTGLPAKSGVSGCVMAVVPGVMGVALYSPRIDKKGNSLRALGALPYLSEKLNLHVFHPVSHIDKNDQEPEVINQAILEKVASKSKLNDPDVSQNYLSNLPESDPKIFGVVIYDTNGNEISIGEVDTKFSIQAAINPIVFGHALETRGLGKVLDKVGVEPSGNPFNAIFFQPETNIPYNPIGNAGAITIDSLLEGSSTSDRLKPLLKKIRQLCGDEGIDVDPEVLKLEEKNSNRNKAIAYMLRQFSVIHDIERPLELYFRQCSIRMNLKNVARMAAVLANGGKCPWTEEEIFSPHIVQRILSVMFTCGLYDYSGRFTYDVGVPAKSGISGIVYGALPGKYGIAVYAPGVDEHGNSIRGVQLFKHLSKLSKLSIFEQI